MPVLTAISVLKYRPQKARREIPDDRAPGLFLIVQPSGAKSWAVRLRRPNGATAKLTLGRVDLADTETADAPAMGGALTLGQARELAAQIDRRRARGEDVVAQYQADKERKRGAAEQRASNSFGACAVEFFKTYKTRRGTRPRRWRDDAHVLGLRFALSDEPVGEPAIAKGSVADVWRDRPVSEIDGHDIHTVVDQARKSSDGRARKLYGAISVLFGWLQRQRRVTVNPAHGVWRPGPPPSRERVLSDDEIVTFWKATGHMSAPAGAMFKLLLLTGCRLREASGMRRSELDDSGAWVLPPARTKNHRTLTLPLPPLALQAIADVPPIEGPFVFTNNGRKPLRSFSDLKLQLDAEMAKIAGKPITPFVLHDLRRTFASGLAGLRVPPHVIEATINHASGQVSGIAAIYNRFQYEDEKASALLRWSQHVENLVADKPPAQRRAYFIEQEAGAAMKKLLPRKLPPPPPRKLPPPPPRKLPPPPRWECLTECDAKVMTDWVNCELDDWRTFYKGLERVPADSTLRKFLTLGPAPAAGKLRSLYEYKTFVLKWDLAKRKLELAIEEADSRGNMEPLRVALLRLTGEDLSRFLERPKRKRGHGFPQKSDPIGEAVRDVRLIKWLWQGQFMRKRRGRNDLVRATKIAADRHHVEEHAVINRMKRSS